MGDYNRYFLELSYNGTSFHGWQIQPNAVTVQELLDKALSTLLRQKTETVGCGRTDAGVHATQFFAHFDVQRDYDKPQAGVVEPAFLNSLNALLPFEIAVRRAFKVGQEAHARFDASLRSYQYHIHFAKDPFRHGFSWHMRDQLNVARMNEAARILFEYTDFSCFSKSHTQVFTNNCKIFRAEWEETSRGLVFHISADRFLRNMVRAIVGTLTMVGKGTISPRDLHSIITSKNRSNAGTSVPACGLYLTEVRYPYV